MLFLLRKIRRKLMSESKISTYLLYAFGEIFLVVVGIMIAVNINNWNQDRKQRVIERKYFLNLKTDLEADIIGLDTLKRAADRKIFASKNIKKRSDRDSVGSLYDFSNVMGKLIFVSEFRPNQNTIDEMKSSGQFSNLQNDSLKLNLLDLNRTYEFIDGIQEHIRNDYNVFLEKFEEYVDWGSYYNMNTSELPGYMAFDSTRIETNQKVMEMDVLVLLDDKVFLNNIFLIELNFTYFRPLLDKAQSDIRVIIDLIDQELETE